MTVPPHSAPWLTTAEVLLESNDGKVFAVLASVITTQSAMFRDMLEGSTAEQLNVPIQLDIDPKSVQHFVNVLINDAWTPGTNCDWQACKTLLAILERFGCPQLCERVVGRLGILTKDSPWEIFVVASQYDNADIAREAILSFVVDPKLQRAAFSSLANCDTMLVRASYALALLAAVLRHTKTDHEVLDWYAIAQSFDPARPYDFRPARKVYKAGYTGRN